MNFPEMQHKCCDICQKVEQNVGKQNVTKSYFQTTRHSLLCKVQLNSSVIQVLGQQ